MLAKQRHAVATVADLAPTAPDAAPATPIDDATKEILSRARARAEQEGLKYAGQVTPQDAWALVSAGAAVIVDVRTVEERKYVGHVPDTLHVAWATGTSMNRNPRFVRELEAQVSKDAVVLLREDRFAFGRQRIFVRRLRRPAFDRAFDHVTVAFEQQQLLAHRVRREFELLGKLERRSATAPIF